MGLTMCIKLRQKLWRVYNHPHLGPWLVQRPLLSSNYTTKAIKKRSHSSIFLHMQCLLLFSLLCMHLTPQLACIVALVTPSTEAASVRVCRILQVSSIFLFFLKKINYVGTRPITPWRKGWPGFRSTFIFPIKLNVKIDSILTFVHSL